MARLIDADALYEAVCRLWDKSDSEDFEKGVFEIIKNAPTIEVPKWIPFEIRPTDDEEREYFKSDTIMVGALPDEGDEILVSKGKYVWEDTFVSDELGVWLDGYGEIEDDMAWMPLPKSYEETNHEQVY